MTCMTCIKRRRIQYRSAMFLKWTAKLFCDIIFLKSLDSVALQSCKIGVSQMENTFYQRNKLANVLGISKETLRYYEEKHIIEPKRDPNNGYRVYDGYDCQTLIMLRMLRSYGYSLEDATASRIGFGDRMLEDKLLWRIEDADSEIRKLKREKQCLEDLLNLSRYWRENRSFMQVEDWNEELFFLEQLVGWNPVVDEERNQAVKLLTSALPIPFYGMLLDRSAVNGTEDPADTNPEHSGIFWRASDYDVLPEEVRKIKYDRKYKWEKVLHFILKLSTDEEENSVSLKQLLVDALNTADIPKYEITSDVVMRILPVSISAADSFLEFMIPIEKTEVNSA